MGRWHEQAKHMVQLLCFMENKQSTASLPCDVLSRVNTLAQSAMSVAVVAILATSAPEAHICCRVLSSAASEGVSWKLWDDRMILVSTGT